MNIQDFHSLCSSFPGVTEHFPFDSDTLVFKVGGKMFALASLLEWEKGNRSANLKCDPERSLELRAQYESVEPGYHMSKVHWNTVTAGGDVPDALFRELTLHSYQLIYNALPKKIHAEIASGS